MKTVSAKHKSILNRHTLSESVFYFAIVIPPLIQVMVYYFAVNIDGILLAFQTYDRVSGKFVFTGLNTIKALMAEIFAPGTGGMWLRSAFLYIVSFIVMAINIAISFFLYKKIPLAGFFKVVLFLPSILPSMAMVLFYKNFAELNIAPNIISNPDTAFMATFIYGLWLGFGGGMILYCGMFARIDSELLDAMKIDGGNLWEEFKHLAWPQIYGLVTINIYTGLGGIFSVSPSTYLFFGNEAPSKTWTIGYYMYAKIVGHYGESLYDSYSITSAATVLFGLVVFVPSLLLKKYFESNDPSVKEYK